MGLTLNKIVQSAFEVKGGMKEGQKFRRPNLINVDFQQTAHR